VAGCATGIRGAVFAGVAAAGGVARGAALAGGGAATPVTGRGAAPAAARGRPAAFSPTGDVLRDTPQSPSTTSTAAPSEGAPTDEAPPRSGPAAAAGTGRRVGDTGAQGNTAVEGDGWVVKPASGIAGGLALPRRGAATDARGGAGSSAAAVADTTVAISGGPLVRRPAKLVLVATGAGAAAAMRSGRANAAAGAGGGGCAGRAAGRGSEGATAAGRAWLLRDALRTCDGTLGRPRLDADALRRRKGVRRREEAKPPVAAGTSSSARLLGSASRAVAAELVLRPRALGGAWWNDADA
jgi:hypothetical protein